MKEIIKMPEAEEYSRRPAEPARVHYGRSWCVNALAVIGVIAAVMLCIASLLAKAELTKLTAERTQMQEYLQQLRDEQVRLEVEYESLYSPGALDEFARSRGMVPALAAGAETEAEDYAVVYASGEPGPAERLEGLACAVSEYFARGGE